MKKRTWIIIGALVGLGILGLVMVGSLLGSSSPSGGSNLALTFIFFLLIAVILLSMSSIVISKVKEHICAVKNGERNKLKPLFKAICFFGWAIVYLVIKICTGWNSFESSDFTLMIALILPGIVAMFLYFLPYLLSNKKRHPQESAIFILNLFAGWTVIAWIVALIWVYTEPKERIIVERTMLQSDADELCKYTELLDRGAISQEEFDAKKKQILGM